MGSSASSGCLPLECRQGPVPGAPVPQRALCAAQRAGAGGPAVPLPALLANVHDWRQRLHQQLQQRGCALCGDWMCVREGGALHSAAPFPFQPAPCLLTTGPYWCAVSLLFVWLLFVCNWLQRAVFVCVVVWVWVGTSDGKRGKVTAAWPDCNALSACRQHAPYLPRTSIN